MTNKLINKLGIGALTLALTGSLNATAQNSEKRDSIYNNQGQLGRVIINGAGKIETIHYKYNNEGLLIEKFEERYLPSGGSNIYQEERTKFNKTGHKIENFWQEDSDNDKKFDRRIKTDYYYDEIDGLRKGMLIHYDEDNDGIYEEKSYCPCGTYNGV